MGHELGYDNEHNNAQAGIIHYPPYRRVVQYVLKSQIPLRKGKISQGKLSLQSPA